MTRNPCEHGNLGGCDIICENCGHTCRRHISGKCDKSIWLDEAQGASEIEVPCGCSDFQGTSG